MMKTNTFLLIPALVLACTSAFANDNTAPRDAEPKVQWGMSMGLNRYTEQKMQLLGTEIGAHVRLNRLDMLPNWQLEGDVMLGRQKYTSTETGDLDGVLNVETRWRALAPVYRSGSGQEGLAAGLGLHTLWNDLRGTTTTGHAGYERLATQLWLPVRWTSANAWELEAGALIRGRHTSNLSIVHPGNVDVTNSQSSGQYAEFKINFKQNDGTTLTPFIRYSKLADSDHVSARLFNGDRNQFETQSVWEPKSQRWQIGAVLNF